MNFSKMSKKYRIAVTVFVALTYSLPAWCDRPLPFFEPKDLTPYWESEIPRQKGTEAVTPAIVKPFKLTNQDDNQVTEKNLDGKISLVNFFFTQCGSLCPMMMSRIRKFQNNLKKSGLESQVWIYSFSVMPEHDTSSVLKNYAKTRSLDLSNWSLLTGTHDEIYGIGKGVFKADRSIRGEENASSFIHTSNLYVVDSKRRIRGIYDTANPQQMALLTQDLLKLKNQE